MARNTIFDDVFRTMVEKMPGLTVPLINEVFGTSYPENVKIIQLRNEHQDEDGEKITDSCLQIGMKLYHIECQSEDDTTMAIRMIQYDFKIGVEHAWKEGRRYRIEFPRSCVLYLRSTAATPDFLEADVILPDGNSFLYHIPAVRMTGYTKDSILSKRLLMLLPFYIMRYEKHAEEFESDPEKLKGLLAEYEDIREHLEKELTEEGRSGLYADLVDLIIKIADYIFRDEEKVRKGLGDVMGGKILELESERLYAAGKAEGEKDMGMLISMLVKEGRIDDIALVARDSAARRKFYEMYGITETQEKSEPIPETVRQARRRGSL